MVVSETCGEDCYKTIEGHLDEVLTEGEYSQDDLKKKWKGPYEGSPRYWNWNSVFSGRRN